jgi:DNA-binding LacI/PurR family transcriptional regulator
LPRHQRLTIKEIARMTGVSAQTVSRVINQRPDVSTATREAVEAAIATTGFQPSAVARSLVHRRSRMIGVIASGLKYFGVAQTLNGITEESETQGYALLLAELGGFDVPDIVPVIELLSAHRVEGIIFTPPQLHDNIAHVQQQLPPSCPPIVFLKAEPSEGFTTVGIDNYVAARGAVEHLLALGRRRIGHIAGPLEWREARDRRDAWRDAVSEAGLEPGPCESGNWSSASGQAAFVRMLAQDPTMDGLFAANDQMALGALHVANARGIRIPGDLAVVGFDGLPESAQFSPSLTTVIQPLGDLGKLAVRELLAEVDEEAGHAWPKTLTIPTELVIRDSAPAPGGTAPE